MSWLPAGFEFGTPHRGDGNVYCIRVEGVGATLCGRRIDHAPVLQPANPAACRECVAVLPSRPTIRRVKEYGACPVCGGDVPVADGIVQRHPEWVVGRGGPTVGRAACTGEGQEPEG